MSDTNVMLSDDIEMELSFIIAESARQLKKWGPQRREALDWMVILTEEVGELAQAILDMRREGDPDAWVNVQDEAIQVATVAIKMASMTPEFIRQN